MVKVSFDHYPTTQMDYFGSGFYKQDHKWAKSAVRTRRYARRRSAVTEVSGISSLLKHG